MNENSINIYGNVINSQIQQGTYGSNQNQNNGFGMGLEACIMLFYAAENEVDIKVVTTLSGTGYYAGKILLNESQSKRELARWEAAKKQLLANGYIEQGGSQGVLFQVTDLGYRVSDGFKEANDLDVSMSPAELMKIFEEVNEAVGADDDDWDEPTTEYEVWGTRWMADGMHKKLSEDGIPIAEGEWKRDKLIKGIEYDSLVHVTQGKLIFKPDCPEDPYDSSDDFQYERIEQYGWQLGFSTFGMSIEDIAYNGLEEYYVADFEVDNKTEQMINIRTLEEFLKKKDPEQLEYLKERIEEEKED